MVSNSSSGKAVQVTAEENSSEEKTHSNLLLTYLSVFFGGAAYLAYVAFSESTLFRIPTAAAAVWCAVAGMLIWRRHRLAVPAYLCAATGAIGWAAFRLWTTGYSGSRSGIILGGLMVAASYKSLSEELRTVTHANRTNEPQ